MLEEPPACTNDSLLYVQYVLGKMTALGVLCCFALLSV